ncbi:MAG: hypothetical protein JWM64_187 [Frankiales bacterium]|nr:hypothetical protein [Frankiales bacterium]
MEVGPVDGREVTVSASVRSICGGRGPRLCPSSPALMLLGRDTVAKVGLPVAQLGSCVPRVGGEMQLSRIIRSSHRAVFRT